MTEPSAPSDAPAVVILAAGESKRMKSARTKVLHEIAGRSILAHVLAAAARLSPARIVVVVGRNGPEIERALAGTGVRLAPQDRPLGTAHALLAAAQELSDFEGDLVVLCGDTPLMRSATLARLLAHHREEGGDATLLTCRFADPSGYGRVVRSDAGGIDAIVEEREADDGVRAIREINTGVYCLRSPPVFSHLEALCREETEHEFYLTDIVARYRAAGRRVGGLAIDDEDETMGINTRGQLARAEAAMRERIRGRWMDAGVTLIDPPSAFIDATATIGGDATLHPFVMVEGETHIGAGAVIGPYCRITDSRIGDGCRLEGWNRIRGVTVADHCVVPPFSTGAAG